MNVGHLDVGAILLIINPSRETVLSDNVPSVESFGLAVEVALAFDVNPCSSESTLRFDRVDVGLSSLRRQGHDHFPMLARLLFQYRNCTERDK